MPDGAAYNHFELYAGQSCILTSANKKVIRNEFNSNIRRTAVVQFASDSGAGDSPDCDGRHPMSGVFREPLTSSAPPPVNELLHMSLLNCVSVVGCTDKQNNHEYVLMPLLVYSVSVWNSLPQTVLSSDSQSVFKSRLKTVLFNQAFTEH